MKVELDLSATQLDALDKNLTSLMENLTDAQKIEIVKSYVNFQFDKLEYSYHDDYWNRDKKEISEFGKQLIAGLQGQIINSVSDEIMSDENLKAFIRETVDNIIADLPKIIEKSITTYIIDNLFNSKQDVGDIIYNYMRNRSNGYRG